MGIRFFCPNGHKVHVKAFQAGQRGLCPQCGVSMDIPLQSTRSSSKKGGKAAPAPAPADDFGDIIPITVHQQPSEATSDAAADDPERVIEIAPFEVVVEDAMAGQSKPTPQATQSPPKPANAGGVSPSDPLADGTDVVWYIRPPSGGQYGPATADVMRKWIAEGRVSGDSLVWREGWRDWEEAASVFPQLASSDAIPDIESILADNTPTPQAPLQSGPAVWLDQSRPASQPRASTGSPFVIMGALVGIGMLILVAVLLWAYFAP